MSRGPHGDLSAGVRLASISKRLRTLNLVFLAWTFLLLSSGKPVHAPLFSFFGERAFPLHAHGAPGISIGSDAVLQQQRRILRPPRGWQPCSAPSAGPTGDDNDSPDMSDTTVMLKPREWVGDDYETI